MKTGVVKNVSKGTDSDKEKDKNWLSDLSPAKLGATATAAVVASLVTTKLTGYVNSILIVGLSSIIIGISSEFFKRIFHKTGKISAKMALVVPYDKVLPGDMGQKINDQLETYAADTETIPPIVEESTDDTVEMPVQEPVTSNHEDDKPGKTGFIGWLDDKISNLSSLTKMACVFLIMAIMVIGSVWAVTTFMEAPSVTNVTTNKITERKVEKMSDQDRQQLERDLTSTNRKSIDDLNAKISAQQSTIDDLNKKMNSLEAANGNASPSPSQSNRDLQNEVTALQSQVSELKSQLQALQQSSGSGQSTNQQPGTQQSQSNNVTH